MSVSISDYVANHSNWISTVLQQWLDSVVLIELDKVDFSTVDGSIRCTVDVYHSLSWYDLRKISTELGNRYCAILPSYEHKAISLYFYVTEDEL